MPVSLGRFFFWIAKLYKIVPNCAKLCQILKLYKTVPNCAKLYKIVQNCTKLYKITKKLYKIVQFEICKKTKFFLKEVIDQD